MKFFTNDVNDMNGYLDQLKQIRSRIHNDAYMFFSSDSFHDAHIFSLKVKNKSNPDI